MYLAETLQVTHTLCCSSCLVSHSTGHGTACNGINRNDAAESSHERTDMPCTSLRLFLSLPHSMMVEIARVSKNRFPVSMYYVIGSGLHSDRLFPWPLTPIAADFLESCSFTFKLQPWPCRHTSRPWCSRRYAFSQS